MTIVLMLFRAPHALLRPCAGQSALFAGFDLHWPVGPYPLGLEGPEVDAAAKVRVSRVLLGL